MADSISQPGAASAGTRERILEAALHVLAARGVAGLTMREVADAAGVATGLANYHFASKQALLLELIAISRARFLGELRQRVQSGAVPALLRQLLEPCAALPEFMPGWFRLNAEIDALGLREPALQEAAAINKQQGADDVYRYLHALAVQAAAPAPVDAAEVRAISDVVYAALDGLAIRGLLDPTFARDAAYRELERWTLSRLAPGSEPLAAPWNADPLAGVDAGPLGRSASAGRAKRPKSKRARSKR
ncbi:MAG TPA: TetR/AcrR family transcriptional regulator [Polyangiales bacterium]|nr:TetR/AcrR family transcriptional regulator [Polyangiales bacterium]